MRTSPDKRKSTVRPTSSSRSSSVIQGPPDAIPTTASISRSTTAEPPSAMAPKALTKDDVATSSTATPAKAKAAKRRSSSGGAVDQSDLEKRLAMVRMLATGGKPPAVASATAPATPAPAKPAPKPTTKASQAKPPVVAAASAAPPAVAEASTSTEKKADPPAITDSPPEVPVAAKPGPVKRKAAAASYKDSTAAPAAKKGKGKTAARPALPIDPEEVDELVSSAPEGPPPSAQPALTQEERKAAKAAEKKEKKRLKKAAAAAAKAAENASAKGKGKQVEVEAPPTPAPASKKAAPPTPAPKPQPIAKKAIKRPRADSDASSRPQSPARQPVASTLGSKTPAKANSNSNKRRKLSPPLVPVPSTSAKAASSSSIPTPLSPSLPAIFPTILASLQAAHPHAFAPTHTGPMFETIRAFLNELRGSGKEGQQALLEAMKAMLRSKGMESSIESLWKQAKSEVAREKGGSGKGPQQEQPPTDGKRKKRPDKGKQKREAAAAAVEQRPSAPGSEAGDVSATASPAKSAEEEDAMDVDEAEEPKETEEQRKAREEKVAEKLAKKQAKKERQEAKKAKKEAKEEKRKEAAAEKQQEIVKSPAAAPPAEPVDAPAPAPPAPSSPVAAPAPTPVIAALKAAEPKSSPAKPHRNRLGRKEKEALRSSRQSSASKENEVAFAPAPAETQSEKPVIEKEQPAPAPESSQPEPDTQKEEVAPAPVPEADTMDVDEEPQATPVVEKPAASPDKMDVESSPAVPRPPSPSLRLPTPSPPLVNGDLTPPPESAPKRVLNDNEEVDELNSTQGSSLGLVNGVANSNIFSSRASRGSSARSSRGGQSAISSDDDPVELELSLRSHCSPARKAAPPLPFQRDSSSPIPPHSEELKAPSPAQARAEDVPLPPSSPPSSVPPMDPVQEEEEDSTPAAVAPPPLQRHETIGAEDFGDSDDSSSDDDSSSESSDEDKPAAAPRPRVKRTSLSAVAAAAFGKPGTPRQKSSLGLVTSPRRNQSQLANVSPAANEEDEFDQLVSQSQPKKRISVANLLPQDKDDSTREGSDDDDASSHFSPVASSVEGTPRAAKKAKGKRNSSEEPDTVDEDEMEDRNLASRAIEISSANADDALDSTPKARAASVEGPTSSAMSNGAGSHSQQAQQPRHILLTTIGSVASSQAGEMPDYDMTDSQSLPNGADDAQRPEESQWQPVVKDSPLFLQETQTQGGLGAGESQLKEVAGESLDPLDQTQVAFPIANGQPASLSAMMDEADTPQKIVVTAPTDDEAAIQTLHGDSPSRPASAAATPGRLTRGAILRAATRSPSPGPGKPRAAATAASKRTPATKATSSSTTSTPKANGVASSSSQPASSSRTPKAAVTKLPSASQPLPSTRLGARTASTMKSLSQLDNIATPKSARTTRSRTVPTQAPNTVPAKGSQKWMKKAGDSSEEESSGSESEEVFSRTATTRSGRKSGSVPPAKSKKNLWG